MAIQIPGIDAQAVSTLYDDDEEIYKTVLCSFVSNIPSIIDKVRSVTSETLPDYLIKIHGLKGNCGSIGAEKLRNEAFKLETMAKNGDLKGIQAGNGAFLEKMSVLLGDVKNWLEQH